MPINKEKDIYLKDGKLDLSILDEEALNPLVNEDRKEEHNTILDDIESMDLNKVDISATLEEMAKIFEEEDEYKKAFNQQRLKEEMEEFDKKD